MLTGSILDQIRIDQNRSKIRLDPEIGAGIGAEKTVQGKQLFLDSTLLERIRNGRSSWRSSACQQCDQTGI